MKRAPAFETSHVPNMDPIEYFRDGYTLFMANKWDWIMGVSLLLSVRLLWSAVFNAMSRSLTYRMAMAGIFDLRLFLLDIALELMSGLVGAPALSGIWFASLASVTKANEGLSVGTFFQGFSGQFFPRIFGLYGLYILVIAVIKHTIAPVFGFWLSAGIISLLIFLSWFSVPIFIRWEDTLLGEAIAISAKRVLRAPFQVFIMILLGIGVSMVGVMMLLVGVVVTLPIAAIANGLAFRDLFDPDAITHAVPVSGSLDDERALMI